MANVAMTMTISSIPSGIDMIRTFWSTEVDGHLHMRLRPPTTSAKFSANMSYLAYQRHKTGLKDMTLVQETRSR
ncbi:hypothetical protein BJV77DRAFT_214647 [Russula vinacea]|nr:hypothetical protein BJV77DRAFT_214647 [Russula vinacea]